MAPNLVKMLNLNFETCCLHFENDVSKFALVKNTIEYTKFMFIANQLLKFYIGGENLDTKLQVFTLPKTFRANVYNNVC